MKRLPCLAVLALFVGCGLNEMGGGGSDLSASGGEDGGNSIPDMASDTSDGGTGADGGIGADGGTLFSCKAHPALLFCEDFESSPSGNAVGTTTWNPSTNSGSLTIDGVHAYGAQALHVHTDGTGWAYIQPKAFAPPQNSFWGRMRVWVTAFPSAPDYAHFTMVEAAGTGMGLVRPIGGQYIPPPTAGQALWGVGSDQGPTGDWLNWKTTAPAQATTWLCLEWQLIAANNQVNVWIDGVAKPELTVTTTMHGGNNVDFVFPAFNSIWFGWWLYQGGSTPSSFDLWLDDIALDVGRIGC